MPTHKLRLFAFVPLSIVALSGCCTDSVSAPHTAITAPASVPQAEAGSLPMAPVLPSYVHMASAAPPAPLPEVPLPLGDLQNQAWRPGYWAYNNGEYSWVPGSIIQKPAFTAVWMPDHWEKRSYGWTFVGGFWQ